MSDTIPMPEGLTTSEIPLSSKLDDLMGINTEIWNSTDDILKNDKRANSLQTRLLQNIYTKLSDPLQVEFESELDEKDIKDETSIRNTFRKSVVLQFEKLNRNINGVISSAFLSSSVENVATEELDMGANNQLLSDITSQITSLNMNGVESSANSQLLSDIESQITTLNRNINGVVSSSLAYTPPMEDMSDQELSVNTQLQLLSSMDSSLLDITKGIETIISNPLVTQPVLPPTEDPTTPEDEEKKQNRFFEGLNSQFEKFTSKVEGVTTSLYDNFMPALLGPLNLITQPLSELTGINPLESLKTGIKGLFGKKASKKPSAEEVAKGGFIGAGFLYMTSMMSKWFGRGSTDEEGSGGGGGIKGFLRSILGKSLGKGLGIGMIITSIVTMIVDGIRGFKLADVWKTSKLSGVLGAVIGGVDKGLKGMFKGMGKWALMGAGVGSIVPGIGTLLGGIVGAVFGGIVGFIGGENIAKVLDVVGNWFKSLPSLIGKGLNIGASWVNEKILSPVWNFITEVFSSITDSIVTATQKTWNLVNMNIVAPIKNFFIDIGVGILEFTTNALELGKNLFSEYIFNPINNFFSTIATGIADFVNDPKSVISKWMDDLVTSITGFFSKMTAMFNYIGEVGFFKGLGNLAKAGISKDDSVDQLLSRYTDSSSNVGEEAPPKNGNNRYADRWVNDAIITKDGQIIHTDVDDNIIATKNDPREISMNNSERPREVVTMPDITNNNNVTIDNTEMVDLLKELVDIMKVKPMGNTTVAQSNTVVDMHSLRMMGVR